MTNEELEKLIKLRDELKRLKNIAYAMRNFNSLVIITKFPHDRIQIDDCDIIKSMTEAGLKIVEKDYEEKEKLLEKNMKKLFKPGQLVTINHIVYRVTKILKPHGNNCTLKLIKIKKNENT